MITRSHKLDLAKAIFGESCGDCVAATLCQDVVGGWITRGIRQAQNINRSNLAARHILDLGFQ